MLAPVHTRPPRRRRAANAHGATPRAAQVELLQSTKNQETRKAEGEVTCITFRKEDFMKLVPLHEFVRDAQQQKYAIQHGGGGQGAKMRGRRFGESAEASTAVTAQRGVSVGAMEPGDLLLFGRAVWHRTEPPRAVSGRL